MRFIPTHRGLIAVSRIVSIKTETRGGQRTCTAEYDAGEGRIQSATLTGPSIALDDALDADRQPPPPEAA